MLSSDAALRGSFSSERPSSYSDAAYVKHSRHLSRLLPSDPQMAERVDAIFSSLHPEAKRRISPEPAWTRHLLTLSARPDDDRGFSRNREVSTENNKPFEAVFENGVQSFLAEISDYSVHLGQRISEAALYGLGKWYLARSIHVSRFGLAIDYEQCDQPYSKWSRGFSDCDSCGENWLRVAEEYPLLLRLLSMVHDQCTSAAIECVQRLAADRAVLNEAFGVSPSSTVVYTQAGLSDPHNRGRSVIRVSFDCGISVVYKPKPLAMDVAIRTFSASSSDFPQSLVPPAIDRGHYGWALHIDENQLGPQSSNTAHLIGRAAAVCWAANATDMHVENIAVGAERIYLLDTETFLAAPGQRHVEQQDDYWRHHSIYTTQLYDYTFGTDRGINISGLSHDDGLSFLGPQIQFDIQDDCLVVSASPKPLMSSEGWPDDARSIRQADAVCCAFRAQLDGDGRSALWQFVRSINRGTVCRTVFRDTIFYWRFQEMLVQPRFLRDAVLFELQTLLLYAGLDTEPSDTSDWYRVVDSERRQMLNLDVPYFSRDIDSTSLLTDNQSLPFFFGESGRAAAMKKIDGMEASDVDEQCDLIKISLHAYKPATSTPSRRSTAGSHEHQLAVDIMRQMSDLIYSGFSPCVKSTRWISLFGDVSGTESRIHIGDQGYFSGSLGIVMAMQAATATLQTRADTKTVDDFLERESHRMRTSIVARSLPSRALLGLDGVGGEIVAYSLLMHTNPRRWAWLAPRMHQSLASIADAARHDDWLDVIAGSAGLVLGCCRALSCGSIEGALRTDLIHLLNTACERLIETQTQGEYGRSWACKGNPRPLLGFAHGWSGIVTALSTARMYVAKRLTARIEDCIAESIEFPVRVLTELGEWKDLRGRAGLETSLNGTWCNGVVGLLRAAVEIPDMLPGVVCDEIKRKSTWLVRTAPEFKENRFCCGRAGVLDLYIDVREVLPNASRHCKTIADRVAESNEACDFHSPPERKFPSLFHGHAGVLYTLARSVDESLPSLSGHDLRYTKGDTKWQICCDLFGNDSEIAPRQANL